MNIIFEDLEQQVSTHSSRGGSVHVYDTADVRTYGVDGSVGAEAGGVHPQVGGALLDHFPDDVHLHLQRRGGERRSACLKKLCKGTETLLSAKTKND